LKGLENKTALRARAGRSKFWDHVTIKKIKKIIWINTILNIKPSLFNMLKIKLHETT
jgi:hypothetical protein